MTKFKKKLVQSSELASCQVKKIQAQYTHNKNIRKKRFSILSAICILNQNRFNLDLIERERVMISADKCPWPSSRSFNSCCRAHLYLRRTVNFANSMVNIIMAGLGGARRRRYARRVQRQAHFYWAAAEKRRGVGNLEVSPIGTFARHKGPAARPPVRLAAADEKTMRWDEQAGKRRRANVPAQILNHN